MGLSLPSLFGILSRKLWLEKGGGERLGAPYYLSTHCLALMPSFLNKNSFFFSFCCVVLRTRARGTGETAKEDMGKFKFVLLSHVISHDRGVGSGQRSCSSLAPLAPPGICNPILEEAKRTRRHSTEVKKAGGCFSRSTYYSCTGAVA